MMIFGQGIRWESNPCLLVHSQACSDRYTTETMSLAAAQPGLEPGTPRSKRGMISVSPLSCSIKGKWTGRGIEPRSPGCRPGVFPLDQPPIFVQEVRPGVEPGLLPYQGSVRPQHLQTKSSGSGSRTRSVELMRLHWALAHPQCQSPPVAKGRVELPRLKARRSERPYVSRFITWP